MSLEKQKHIYFRQLRADKQYLEFIAKPLSTQRVEFESILKDVDSSDGQIRYAQGALKVLDWHNNIFDYNDLRANALERKEQEKRHGRNREPNYTSGRYLF